VDGIVEVFSDEMVALHFVVSPEIFSEMPAFLPGTLLISTLWQYDAKYRARSSFVVFLSGRKKLETCDNFEIKKNL